MIKLWVIRKQGNCKPMVPGRRAGCNVGHMRGAAVGASTNNGVLPCWSPADTWFVSPACPKPNPLNCELLSYNEIKNIENKNEIFIIVSFGWIIMILILHYYSFFYFCIILRKKKYSIFLT